MTFLQDASHADESTFLPWCEANRLGVRRFDEEHARMAALIGHLHATMIVRRDKPLSLKVFERLILETRRHFDGEEALMEELGYPALEAHSAEHARLITEAEEMARNYGLGHISALALPEFLRKWLLHHIDTCDRAYTDFFRTHGIP